jgi:hypothetical protein
MHPALHLAQHVLDPVDPANHAVLFRRPPPGVGHKHLLLLLAREDERTPFTTQHALAIAARLPQTGGRSQPLDSVDLAGDLRLRGNVATPEGPRTQAVKVYDQGSAGVAFTTEGGIGDLNRFFGGLLTPEGPVIDP